MNTPSHQAGLESINESHFGSVAVVVEVLCCVVLDAGVVFVVLCCVAVAVLSTDVVVEACVLVVLTGVDIQSVRKYRFPF